MPNQDDIKLRDPTFEGFLEAMVEEGIVMYELTLKPSVGTLVWWLRDGLAHCPTRAKMGLHNPDNLLREAFDYCNRNTDCDECPILAKRAK
jgi:hypothetical protein